MVTTSSDQLRASNHVTVIRGLKETPQALALRALRAISKSAASTLLLDKVPDELLFGERVDLHRWTIIVDDATLTELSRQHGSGKQYYLDTCAETLHGIFKTFWTATTCPRGLLQINISGSKEVTDYGLAMIAHASPELASLVVAGCAKVSDVSLREVALNCPKLQQLDISSCFGIEGPGLSSIAECCLNLTKLNVSKCANLKNWSLQKLFRGCHHLEEVNVSYVKNITDEEIRVLAENSPDLIALEAIECLYLSDQSVLNLSQHCKDLDAIDLSRSEMAYRISDVSLMALGQRALSLRSLKLARCDQLSDVGIGWLSEGCRVLEVLDLNGCSKITDAGLRVLGNHCHALTALDISHAKAVSDVGISSLARGCPALKTLRCHGMFLLTDPSLAAASMVAGKTLEPWEEVIGLAALASRCPQLEVVDVSGCFRLNRVIGQYLIKLRNLRNLNIKGCNQCLPNSLLSLAAGLPLLEVLVLSDCGKAINNKVLQAFAQCCPKIHTLHVSRCDEVKEGAIKAVSSMACLQVLEMSGCRGVTDSMLVHLTQIERVPELHHLDMTHCPKVGDSFLAWMSMKPHKLLHLCLLGTAVSRKALLSVRDRFPNCDMLANDNFFGFWPKHRVRDRMLLNSYHQMIQGITKIQSRLRKHMAILRVRNIHEERWRLAAQFRLQRVARGFLARRRVHKLRDRLRLLNWSTVHIVALFRRVVARRRMQRIRDRKDLVRRNLMATRIQVRFRMFRDQCRLARMKNRLVQRHGLRVEATIIIQSFGRMTLAKARVSKIKELRRTRERVVNRKALVIQRCFRGHVSRRNTAKFKAALATWRRLRQQAASVIQRYFRRHRTDQIVARGQEVKQRRARAILRMQAVLRGALARLHVMELRMEYWVTQKKKAVVVIQCRWRVFKAREEFFRRIRERRDLRAMLDSAANVIIRQTRMKLAWNAFARKHAAYIARLTEQAQREINAATKIQAMVRSHFGRKIYHEKLREKKSQWKELFDEEKRKRFFYNKQTGEVRWRIPKDLLDLIPHPACDNCSHKDAMLECSECNELFCGPCFQQVHSGGRRCGHAYRALYDFYGRRLDYGDGEFPCQWPSEVVQDEIQGWMLRINPYRKPIEVYQCGWEKYEDVDPGRRTLKNIDEWRVKDNMGKGAPKVFYFQRSTFQTTYEIPDEVAAEVEERRRKEELAAAQAASFGAFGFNYTASTPYSRSQSQRMVVAATPGTANSYDESSYQVDPNAQSDYYGQNSNYDPSDPWYQGYYDEAGNWVYYNYDSAGAVDNSMALVPAPNEDSMGMTRLQSAGDSVASGAMDYGEINYGDEYSHYQYQGVEMPDTSEDQYGESPPPYSASA